MKSITNQTKGTFEILQKNIEEIHMNSKLEEQFVRESGQFASECCADSMVFYSLKYYFEGFFRAELFMVGRDGLHWTMYLTSEDDDNLSIYCQGDYIPANSEGFYKYLWIEAVNEIAKLNKKMEQPRDSLDEESSSITLEDYGKQAEMTKQEFKRQVDDFARTMCEEYIRDWEVIYDVEGDMKGTLLMQDYAGRNWEMTLTLNSLEEIVIDIGDAGHLKADPEGFYIYLWQQTLAEERTAQT